MILLKVCELVFFTLITLVFPMWLFLTGHSLGVWGPIATSFMFVVVSTAIAVGGMKVYGIIYQ